MTTALKLDNHQLKRLAELLMGAAHADNMYDGEEAETIGEVLRSVVGEKGLPPEVSSHIARFDVDDLNVEQSCQGLDLATVEQRAVVFSLLLKVINADEIHDFAESAYLRKVGAALGAAPDEYEHLTFEILPIEPI